MLYIVIALKLEANSLIKTLQLHKNLDKNFSIYENDFIKLIISGMGAVNSAIASTYLLTNYKADKNDKIINIGTCASKYQKDIGEMFNIDKVIDATTNKVYHLKKSQNSLAISTYPTPQTDKTMIKTPLVDMESAGFFVASSKFIKKDNIMIKKIVSDNLEDNIKEKDFIDNIFDKHIKKIYEECISYRG